MPPAEQMQMQMLNRLSAVFANVDDHAIPGSKFLFASEFGYSPQQVAKQCAVFGRCFCERDNVFARDYQQMHGSLRVNVREGDALFILVNAR